MLFFQAVMSSVWLGFDVHLCKTFWKLQMPSKGHVLKSNPYVNSSQCPQSLCVDLWDVALWTFKV